MENEVGREGLCFYIKGDPSVLVLEIGVVFGRVVVFSFGFSGFPVPKTCGELRYSGWLSCSRLRLRAFVFSYFFLRDRTGRVCLCFMFSLRYSSVR